MCLPVCQEPCCQCLLGTHIFFLFSDFQAATGFWTKTEKLASPSTTYCISSIGWGIRCSCCGHTFKTFPLKWWIISSDVICPRWCSVQRLWSRLVGRRWNWMHGLSSILALPPISVRALHYTAVELKAQLKCSMQDEQWSNLNDLMY